ncbi:MAG: PLP-dependent aminotransferase family protein [Acidobacteriaceae bacterium]|nr:PLP-dependent aminotransferase family protein [Acidobacteriaceae bacterium]
MNSGAQAAAMNFLNEVADEFPSAISFAAGRPTDRFFGRLNGAALLDAVARYERHARISCTQSKHGPNLLQYGRTAGIIGELVIEQLASDEGVHATPDRVIMTSGCQEALALCLPALCPDKRDVALTCNPTYIGFTCAAQAGGASVVALSNKVVSIADAIERAVRELRRIRRRPRALYLIPNFDNPTGRLLDERQRKDILDICRRERIVVLEDDAYGMFQYDGEPVASMSALDQSGCVIHLSTFSKTVAPAVRVGTLVLPESLFGDQDARKSLWKELVQRKSFITVNTSQITQAIVGGLLLQENRSLKEWIRPAVNWYRTNRDVMLDHLKRVFAPISTRTWWNRPAGGFFLVMKVPFRFDADSVTDCATKHGVVVMPMSFFAFDKSQDHRIRLAFTCVDPEQIRIGIEALGDFVASRMGKWGNCRQQATVV